jgi:hypothetical protein
MKTQIFDFDGILIVIASMKGKAYCTYHKKQNFEQIQDWSTLSKFQQNIIDNIISEYCNDNDLIKYSY